MMRVLALWYPANPGSPPSETMMTEMGKLINEMAQAGVLLDTGGWDANAPATVVTNRNGTIAVTDGPYTEAKEVIGGYAVMRVATKDDLIAWGKRFVDVAGEGRSVMRPIPDEPLGG